MGYYGPAVANMESYESIERNRANLEWALDHYNATEEDCRMENVESAKPWEGSLKCHYQLRFTSYIGWKVYMFCTGCFASDPEYERKMGLSQ